MPTPGAVTTNVRSAPRERGVAGVGQIHIWNGGSLWIGHSVGQAAPHDHHAIQVSLALKETLLLRGEADAAWIECQGAVVPSHLRHRFDGCNTVVGQLFVEPETASGRALEARFGTSRVVPLEADELADLLPVLNAAYAGRHRGRDLAAAARQVIRLLAGEVPSAAAVDPRIETILAEMPGRLGGAVSLAWAANSVHLSPSRFRHLFVAQTRSSFRAYVLWLRIQAAIRTATAGATWTEAAHAAGFADSAHLSRTFRRMFGIVPAMLVIE